MSGCFEESAGWRSRYGCRAVALFHNRGAGKREPLRGRRLSEVYRSLGADDYAADQNAARIRNRLAACSRILETELDRLLDIRHCLGHRLTLTVSACERRAAYDVAAALIGLKKYLEVIHAHLKPPRSVTSRREKSNPSPQPDRQASMVGRVWRHRRSSIRLDNAMTSLAPVLPIRRGRRMARSGLPAGSRSSSGLARMRLERAVPRLVLQPCRP